jgi:hypothetical protein
VWARDYNRNGTKYETSVTTMCGHHDVRTIDEEDFRFSTKKNNQTSSIASHASALRLSEPKVIYSMRGQALIIDLAKAVTSSAAISSWVTG